MLMGGAPSAAVGQSTKPGNNDNTAYGTTSAEFLLLGAGAGAPPSAGRMPPWQPMHRPFTTIRPAPLWAPARALWSAQWTTWPTPSTAGGGIAFPFGGNSVFGLQLGTFGFKDQQVYTVEAPDGTGATYSVNETFVGLTYGQQFSDRFYCGASRRRGSLTTSVRCRVVRSRSTSGRTSTPS